MAMSAFFFVFLIFLWKWRLLCSEKLKWKETKKKFHVEKRMGSRPAMERFWVRKVMNSPKKMPFFSGIVKVELLSMLSRVHFIYFFVSKRNERKLEPRFRVGFSVCLITAGFFCFRTFIFRLSASFLIKIKNYSFASFCFAHVSVYLHFTSH